MHKYTDEEKAYLKEIIPGRKYVEIAQLATEKFGWNMTTEQVKGFCGREHVRTGTYGYFQKGHTPYNKGQKGTFHKGSEKTWFKKGQAPYNTRPIGSEVLHADGYIWVKVAEPNVCREKHRYIWEQAYGEIPKGSVLIFRDNNPQNCVLDNLMLISRRAHAILNGSGMNKCVNEEKDTAVLLAYQKIAIIDARKKRKERVKKNGSDKKSCS